MVIIFNNQRPESHMQPFGGNKLLCNQNAPDIERKPNPQNVKIEIKMENFGMDWNRTQA
jgi:hypothetical protein